MMEPWQGHEIHGRVQGEGCWRSMKRRISSETNAIAAMAKDLGITPETLGRWRNQSDATVAVESKRSAEDAMDEFIGMLDDHMV